MTITYILSFPTSLIYHIFSQIDFKKEWGDASIYSLEYKEFLNKNYENLAISGDKKDEIKKNLKDYFLIITFACLRPWYTDYEKIINDFKNPEFIAKKLSNYPDLSFEKTEKAFIYLTNLMEDNKNDYLFFWKENEEIFNEKIENFKKFHTDIFSAYYQYLHERINPIIPIKDNFFIFLIPSLFNYGRGLEGGCAIGIPYNREQIQKNTIISLHELTHAFTNNLIATKLLHEQKDSPNQMENHQLKEQLAEYVLQEYLKQNYPDLSRKEILSYPLLTEEIKKSLGI